MSHRLATQSRQSNYQPDSSYSRADSSVRSYVIGFILCLVLTIVPYYLVVNHRLAGTSLLAAILGFAAAQMIVQVTFFLHLGRGPKPNWNLFFYISTVGIVMIVVGGSILIINNLHYNMSPSDQTKKLINDEGIYQISGVKTGACYGQHNNHKVIIINSQASPEQTYASQCDTLTFISKDSVVRDIAFGPHANHQAYAGEDDLLVRKNVNQTITLSEPGTYQFHDHLDPTVNGSFTVSP